MPEALPEALREADAALHAVTARLRFSAHLNPTNIAEARAAFVAGADAPPFTYAPAAWADDAIGTLRRVRIPTAHPLGQVLDAARAETTAWITALKERTPAAFDALAERCGWPLRADAPASLPTPSNVATPRVPAEALITALRGALRARGFEGWVLVRDEVMSARVLVDASKREIRVHPGAVFREADLDALVAHEIDVHAVRGENGMRQPLRIFADGLPGALTTEEGLAMLAEERIGTLSPAFEARQLMLAESIHHARAEGFRAVFTRLRERVGADAAFQMALRVKRGLADPGGPGAYAKDGVYLHGWRRVRAWLAEGGDIGLLYVGKVGLEHPVADWLARGWVRTGPVPRLWDGVGGALARGLLRAEAPARPVALRVAR